MQPKLAWVYSLAFTYNYLKLSLFNKIQLKVTSLCSLLCIEVQKNNMEKVDVGKTDQMVWRKHGI